MRLCIRTLAEQTDRLTRLEAELCERRNITGNRCASSLLRYWTPIERPRRADRIRQRETSPIERLGTD